MIILFLQIYYVVRNHASKRVIKVWAKYKKIINDKNKGNNYMTQEAGATILAPCLPSDYNE